MPGCSVGDGGSSTGSGVADSTTLGLPLGDGVAGGRVLGDRFCLVVAARPEGDDEDGGREHGGPGAHGRQGTDRYRGAVLEVSPVNVRDEGVAGLIDALTVELADEGYTDEESFGYSAAQLEQSGVHLVGASVDGRLVGLGGVELQDGGVAELKRFYVDPSHRGLGIADAVIEALVEHARVRGTTTVRLETGDKQYAAIAFYSRHGFAVVPRFPPYVDSATSVCMQRRL